MLILWRIILLVAIWLFFESVISWAAFCYHQNEYSPIKPQRAMSAFLEALLPPSLAGSLDGGCTLSTRLMLMLLFSLPFLRLVLSPCGGPLANCGTSLVLPPNTSHALSVLMFPAGLPGSRVRPTNLQLPSTIMGKPLHSLVLFGQTLHLEEARLCPLAVRAVAPASHDGFELVLAEIVLVAICPLSRPVLRHFPHACCGVVSNGCCDVSALRGAVFKLSAAPLPPPKPAIACTS
jgi:hypothetical protein